MNRTEQLKKQLLTKREVKALDPKELLSSGSTVLNLLCTGRTTGFIPKGTYALIVGDSDAGKTVAAGTILAEAANNPNFDDYRLILDDPEIMTLDIEHFFGKKLAERIERPAGTDDDPIVSTTVEELYEHLDKAFDKGKGKPFIYILDSENILSSDAEAKKIEKTRAARRNQQQAAGTMTDDKAKVHSRRLRIVRNNLKTNGSILIIISQTRDNFGFGAQFDPKTRAGGWALKFYAKLEIWLSVRQQITKQIKGKKRQLGIITKFNVKKNHLTGKKGSCLVPILWSHGIDNTGGMIDYLIDEGHWKGSENNLRASEFRFSGAKEDLIALIESKSKERQLRKIVGQVWRDRQAACIVERKVRYE
jgi:RecA/RadA recombinase